MEFTTQQVTDLMMQIQMQAFKTVLTRGRLFANIPASLNISIHDALGEHHDLVLPVSLGDEQHQQEYDNLQSKTYPI